MIHKIFIFLLCFSSVFSALQATTLTVNVNTDSQSTTGGAGAGTTGDLRYVLNYINQNPDTYNVVFNLSAGNETITLAGLLPVLNLNAANPITIDGSNALGSAVQVTLNGGGSQRGFFAQQGSILIENMNISNMSASGGTGGSGGINGGSGGGGLGAGAGLFINQANVIVSNLNFTNNNATGGTGGASAGVNIIGGGGGGMGGNGGGSGGVASAMTGGGGGGGLGGIGGNGGIDTYGGGGGIAPGGAGSSAGTGSIGGGYGAGSGGSGQLGTNAGGANAGGGGGSVSAAGEGGGGGGKSGGNGGSTTGGIGGFGGGGGASSGAGGFAGGGGGASGFAAGNGGFGGGGGGTMTAAGGGGGFGGGGGGSNLTAGTGGVGAGSGSSFSPGHGGGGAGLGGAIFVNSSTSYGGGGGTLTVSGPLTTTLNTVTAGASGGAGATAGASASTDIFATSGQPLTFNPGALEIIAINGSIGDDSSNTLPGGSYTAGAGAGVNVIKNGAGTLQLLGTNTYIGNTTLSAGTLQLNSNASLGASSTTLNVTGTSTVQAAAAFTATHPINLNTNALTFDTNGNNVSWGGAISGAGGSLTKISPGTLTLTSTNTYTAGTTITAGTLALSGSGSLSSTGAVSVNGGATFDISGASGSETIGDYSGAGNTNLGANSLTVGTSNSTSYSGVISGAGGGLTKQGTGVLTLSGLNTYTGATSVTAGGLIVSHNSTGSFAGAYSISSGAQLDFEQSASTTETYSGGLSGSGNFTVNQNGGTGTVVLTGPMTFLGTSTVYAGTLRGAPTALPLAITDNTSAIVDFEQTAGSGTYAGSITGGGGVVINSVGGNTGTVIFSGANSYTGGTSVIAGTLQGTTASVQGAISASLNATVDFEQTSGTGTYAGIISGAGKVAVNSIGGNTGTVVFTGANTYSGGTTLSRGTLLGTTTSLQGNILANSPGIVDFEQTSGSGTYSGVISGTGAVAINTISGDVGTVNFSGANTYTGGTSVSRGTLKGTTTSLQGNIAVSNAAAVDFEQTSSTGTYTGVISGAGEVVINSNVGNTGTVFFSGANTYTGGTTINRGTLQGTTTSLQGNVDVNTSAFIDFEQNLGTGTYSGSISGLGGVVINSIFGNNGTVVFAGSNNYSGGTSVVNGALLGTTSSLQGNIAVNSGATVDFEQTSGSGTYSGSISGAGQVAINSIGGNTGTVIFNGSNSYTGGTTLYTGTLQGTTTGIQGNILTNGGTIVDFERASGSGTYSGIISGAGGVVINSIGSNTGTVVFSGANTYTGGTLVNSGTLQVAVNTLPGNAVVNIGGLIDFEQVSGSGLYNGIISGNGGVAINKAGGVGTVIFSGANTYTHGTVVFNGTLQGTTTSLQGNISVNSGANLDFEQNSSTGTYAGVISGAGSVAINSIFGNTGTVVFTGNNTYSGGTSVSAGTLQGTTASLQGNISVNTGGTVDFEQNLVTGTYSGIISGGGAVTINNAGNTGTVIFTGANTYSGGTTVFNGKLQGTTTSLQGPISASAGATVDFEQASGSGNYTNVISGAGSVAINSVSGNTGTVVFTGANTYTGGTTVFNGILQGNTTSLQGPIVVNSPAVVDFEQASGTGTYSGVISGFGGLAINSVSGNNGTIVLTGANTYSGGTTVYGGILRGTTTSIQGNVLVNTLANLDFEQAAGSGTYSGNIAGGGSVSINTQAGSLGTVIFSGVNSYTGGTTVAAGTLQGTTNSLQGNIQGALGTTIDFEQTPGSGTYSGIISGPTAVVINSIGGNTGTVNFTGPNIYTGGTTVNNGTLKGNVTSIQGNVAVSSGANVDFEQTSGTGTYSAIISGAGGVVINSTSGNAGTVFFNGANTYSGGTNVQGGVLQGTLTGIQGNIAVSSGAAVALEQTSGNGTYAGQISGAGAVAINVNPTSLGTISFSNINTYTGGTAVFHGTLLGAPNSIQGNVNVFTNANLDFEQTTGTGTFAGNISGGGHLNVNVVPGSIGKVVLTGVNSYTGGTTVANGILEGTPISLQGNIVVQSPAVLDVEQTSGTAATSANISGSGSVLINSESGSNGTVVFNGTNSYTGGTTIVAGTLAGDTSSLQGTIQDNSVLQFLQNTNGTFNGTINGAGVIGVSGQGVLTFNTNHTAFTGNTIVNGGIFSLTASLGGNVEVTNGFFVDNGIVLGNITVNGGGRLSGVGQALGNVRVKNQGIIAPGNSIGTFTVGGNYTQEAGSTYAVEVNAAGHSSLINVGGIATLDNGSAVAVTKMNGVLINTPYKILFANGGLFGQYSTISVLNPFFKAIAVYDANDAYLIFKILFSGIASESTFNEQQVAIQMDSIPDNPTADIQEILQEFALLSTDQILHSLSQMSASQYTNLLLTAELANRQFVRRMFDPIREMITENPCTPYAYCRYKPAFDVWSSISGGRSFIDGNKNAPGFRVADYQVAVGAQARFTKNFLIGSAVSYERDSINYKLGGSGHNNVVLGGIYALFRPQNFYIWGDINGGYNSCKITRKIHIGSLNYRTKGKVNPYQFAGYVEIGTDFGFNFLLVQPFLGIDFGRFQFDKFDETGGHPLGVDVFSKSYTNMASRLGVHFTSAPLKNGLSMGVDLSWNYRLTSLDNDLHVRFQAFGTKFKIKGLPLQRNSFEGAVKFNQQWNKHWSFYFEGLGEGWNNSFTYSFLGGIKASW